MRQFFTSIFLLALVLSATSSWAQDVKSGARLDNVIIEGTQRIEPETIKSYMKLKQGDVISAKLIDESLQNIFATGLFSDITFRQAGATLIITVTESPIINQVSFEGNKRINDEALEKEIRLKPRAVYNKTDVQNDTKRVLDLYHKSGRFSARVEPKIISLEQNRVNLVFEIDEGKKTEIRGIFFTGNKNFSDSRLRSEIQTKVSRWYRFLSSDDTYDPDRVNFDQESLRRFYTKEGFADFRVKSVNAELNGEQDAFFITFAVEEGERYNFGKIDIQTDFKDLDTKALIELVRTEEGNRYNAEEVEKSISAITDKLGTFGYAFVDVEPKIDRVLEKKLINLTYTIKEGPRVYVDKINIKGNVRTLDKVIRREFRLAEGDPYNSDKLKRSQQRIKNLGFFDKAEITNARGSAPDKININVDIEERSTGELSLGAGFSTTDGALGEVGVTERNVLGTGRSLRLNTRIAQKRQEIDLGFTEPYFLDRDISAGFDLFNIRRNRRVESSFNSDTKGFNLRASYPFNEHLTHSIKYTLRTDDVFSIREDASRFIKAEQGIRTTSMIGHSFLYDKTDNKFDPTEGYFIRLNQDFAGLGGDSQFIRHEIRSGLFIPTFSDKWVLKFSAKAGNVEAIGDEVVDINNRFFLGGVDLRGFSNDGIGPRDSITRDALGGNTYYSGSVEFGFPLGLPEELGFSGSVFTDVGSLFGTDLEGAEIVDDSAPRLSTGIGISWSSPLGPVRVDIAKALVKNEVDDEQTLRFSFGTRF